MWSGRPVWPGDTGARGQTRTGPDCRRLGENSSAAIAEDGVLTAKLDGGLRGAGLYLTFGRDLDLRDRQHLYLCFDIKSDQNGPNVPSVSLRDGSESEGRDGYQVATDLPSDVSLTTQWQRVVIPLTAFPDTGENWSLPVPPGAQRPLRKRVDLSRITTFGMDRGQHPTTLYLRNVSVSAHPDQGPVSITTPLALPKELDLSHGSLLPLSAAFSAPTRWELTIGQGTASRTFSGLRSAVSAQWDGAADKGVFSEGPCDVRITYGNGTRESITTRFHLAGPHSPRVQVAQAGYLTTRPKTACLMGEKTSRGFRVINAQSRAVAFSGTSAQSVWCEPAADWGCAIDFSAVQTPGDYYLEVEGVGRSYTFTIRDGLFAELSRQAMKSYYYQRCGMDLVTPYAGPYERKACHTDDGYLYAGCQDDKIAAGPHIASTGGWHDAGDFGKKVVPVSDALSYLMLLYELFPEKAKALHTDIPGDASTPDMLREIRFELDWMLTMQQADGGVCALITTQDFAQEGMPDKDLQTRYLVPISSCATADFAAIMARTSRIFARYDATFATRCRASAIKAWDYLQAHPQIVPAGGYHDPAGIHGTGTYDDNDDRDERFWAACELFAATGEATYNQYVRDHYTTWKPLFSEPPGYMHTQGFGLYTYLLCGKGDQDLVSQFRDDLLGYARRAAAAVERSPYGIAIELTPYWWNSLSAMQSATALIVAHTLSPDEAFITASLRQLNYVLGVNPVDTCYVTGAGSRSVKDPLQAACVADGIATPIPGFMVPGANLVAWDLPMQRYQEAHKLPPLKNYQDYHRAASVNEVCLNTNAPYVFVITYFGQ